MKAGKHTALKQNDPKLWITPQITPPLAKALLLGDLLQQGPGIRWRGTQQVFLDFLPLQASGPCSQGYPALSSESIAAWPTAKDSQRKLRKLSNTFSFFGRFGWTSFPDGRNRILPSFSLLLFYKSTLHEAFLWIEPKLSEVHLTEQFSKRIDSASSEPCQVFPPKFTRPSQANLIFHANLIAPKTVDQ